MVFRIALLILTAGSLMAADYKAGVARTVITPTKPIYMSGYASRNHPSEGVVHDLWAKALAIEDSKGNRAVIVSMDLIGIPRSMGDLIAARVLKDYGLDRERLLLNASHTHTGPIVSGNLESMFQLEPADRAVAEEYRKILTEKLIALIGESLQRLEPADLHFANGTADFAVNRREWDGDRVKIGVNPRGPTDHDVPVLRVTAPDGKIRAIIFGYACHNTTLSNYLISGDYAGYAQIEIEKANPGATAMFITLCGADQNPNPRGQQELAEKHGASLAAKVQEVLSKKMSRANGEIRAAFQTVDLMFAAQNREMYEARLQEKDRFRVQHAKAMLALHDAGRPIRQYPYPVQAIRFGNDYTILALGGEVVVDYALRAKEVFGEKGLMVAGYSNDVMSYIPSLRVLREGGYEADHSMIYYGLPGPYNEEVEERIFDTIHSVMTRVGIKAEKLDIPKAK